MQKAPYQAPRLTVVSFRNERGYAGSSDGNPLSNLANQINEQADATLRQWESEQVVSGFNATGNPDDGLAAGYFYEGQTEGWF